MDAGRLGQGRAHEQASVGDLVVCIDTARVDIHGHTRRFIGLVLDKSISVYKILVIESGREVYWPEDSVYSWKGKE